MRKSGFQEVRNESLTARRLRAGTGTEAAWIRAPPPTHFGSKSRSSNAPLGTMDDYPAFERNS